MNRSYNICSKCIMDTSDPDIEFDGEKICSHCHRYNALVNNINYLNKRKPGAFRSIIEKIKKDGKNRKYDCIVGVSGGVDSTYTVYLAKKSGLRPLAVHVDNGWNTELSVSNIEKILKKLNVDLYTYVLDWEEFRDLQKSFLKASTPDLEIPSDHAIIAVPYIIAEKYGIKYILSGHNVATEGGGVVAWSQGHMDWGYIKNIYKKYTGKKLKKYPHIGPLEFIYFALIKKIKWIQFLDYSNYNKEEAVKTIEKELGWRNYGGKHYESIYTRFYQGYILPNKFGYDKRRLHLSSLIWSGQMKRFEALKSIEISDYPNDLMEEDRDFVIKKLGISDREFSEIMNAPNKTILDYYSYKKILYRYKWLISIYHYFKRS